MTEVTFESDIIKLRLEIVNLNNLDWSIVLKTSKDYKENGWNY